MEWYLWMILVPVGVCLSLAVVGLVIAFFVPSPGPRLRDRQLYFWAKRYLWLVHRWKIEGAHHMPTEGGVLIVANHTAGLDPILVSTACPRFVRWIMALDMRLPQLEWFWSWQQIIFVGRDGKKKPKGSKNPDRATSGLRAAMDELHDGGVVGIFPEGGIERPPEHVMPFQAGVGLMIRKAKVPVVPVWISGTPQVENVFSSLWHRSRTRVVFGEPIDYTDKKMTAAEIAEDLRGWMIQTSGWATNDTPRGSKPDHPGTPDA